MFLRPAEEEVMEVPGARLRRRNPEVHSPLGLVTGAVTFGRRASGRVVA
ncbi:MAG: hypothetical protein AVDCRST_MAG03-1972 [uncultured Rubrobacteraceae bacterium]|uniref:Uncharacterized protein n=1 Tax=uncultured Rubrobacteraceae bacterium TaxID=349277 RepID=A0A6J4PGX3_9ACTN|nr:MAG: hypothetical protein AVDCRST_MAG03-1972 [uncultured Rubrobacteraceae bacterium]